MYYWEMIPKRDETIVGANPAEPNNKTYWPQISGKVVLDAEHREALFDEALAAKVASDPPVSVLHQSSPLYLKKEGNWQESIKEAVRAGRLIHRVGYDEEVERCIAEESAKWHEEFARGARRTIV